jgi:hypothetical protein
LERLLVTTVEEPTKNCARGGYPAFRNDDPAECAEAEFVEWRTNSL